MSTNKTKNYALHSWEAGDDFLRSEFNENFAKLDGALFQLVVTGAYVGDGAESQAIELGFKPRAVMVTNSIGMFNDTYRAYSAMATTQQNAVGSTGNPILAITDNGFTVHYLRDTATGSQLPCTNMDCRKYSFFAIK